MRRLASLLIVAACCSSAWAQLAGNGQLVSTALPGGQYQDVITVNNTGTTTVGTFWFAWVPGEDFLPSQPTNITSPPGWVGGLIPDFAGTYSIEWYASSPASYIPAGQSLAGFGFTSPDSPATLGGVSAAYPRYHCTDSYLYVGGALGDPGLLFRVGVTVGATCGSADYNCDGNIGTDSDIEAFFACLAGSCPSAPCTSSADFNGDGNVGTDADIEAFFRVLAGGSC